MGGAWSENACLGADLWPSPLDVGRSRHGGLLCRGPAAESSESLLVFHRDKQFAQRMDIATEHGQGNVTFKSDFAHIAATHQSVAGLQRADRRFDSGVTLLGLMEFDRRGLCLHDGLFAARFRQANIRDDFGKLLLVFRSMKAAIEREFFDPMIEPLLQLACLLDCDVSVLRITRHDVMVGNETFGIFKDQHESSELIRLARLAVCLTCLSKCSCCRHPAML